MAKSSKKTSKSSTPKASPGHDHGSIVSPEGYINVSQSKVNAWRKCRKMFYYKYILQIVPKRRRRPFAFGGIVHEMLEADFEGQDAFKVLKKIDLEEGKMFRKEREMYGDIIEDIRLIMKDYFDHYEGSLKPIEFKGRKSEHEFRIELEDGLWFTGRIDSMVKANKLKWLEEHKTFKRQPSEEDRWRSVQGATYIRAMEMVGGPSLDGVLWDYISSKPLMVPGMLTKTGKVSQARIDSLPSAIKAWIKKEGHDKKQYTKLLTDAKENRSTRFVRVFAPVRPRVVDSIWNDFVQTAKEIHDLHRGDQPRTIGWGCRMCDYQAICKAEVHGNDVDFVIKAHYTAEDQSHKRDASDRVSDD